MEPHEARQAAVEGELRAMVGASTIAPFRGLEVPTVAAMAAAHCGPEVAPLDRVLVFVDAGIAGVSSPQYREAAAILLASGPQRWRPLARRGEEAGRKAFDVGYDGLRKKRVGAPSLLDQTLAEVAESLCRLADGQVVAPLPAAVDVPVGDFANQVTPSPDPGLPLAAGERESGTAAVGRGRSWRSLGLTGAAVAVAAAAAFLLLSLRGDGAPDQAGPPAAVADPTSTVECRGSPGELAGGAEEDLAAWSEPMRDAYKARGGVIDLGCPTDLVQRWQQLVYQPFGRDRPTGVLVGADPSSIFFMTYAEWGSYRQVGGKSGDNAQALIGLPEPPRPVGDHVEIPTDKDGVLVGVAPDGPFFFLINLVKQKWLEEGGADGRLGLPMSNPVITGGRLRQDFVGGYMELETDGQLAVQDVPDPADPDLARRAPNHLIRHSDATVWFITGDGRRKWIPDTDTWLCHRGSQRLVANDVRGYTIATFPYGGQATCEDAESG